MTEARGTTICPVCGVGEPHSHDMYRIQTWLEYQAFRFGYTTQIKLTTDPHFSTVKVGDLVEVRTGINKNFIDLLRVSELDLSPSLGIKDEVYVFTTGGQYLKERLHVLCRVSELIFSRKEADKNVWKFRYTITIDEEE